MLILFKLVLTGSGQELRKSDFVDLIQSTSSITSVGMGQDNEEDNKFTVHLEHQLKWKTEQRHIRKKIYHTFVGVHKHKIEHQHRET